MRAKKFAKPAARRTALTATLVRFVGNPRFDRLRDHPLFHPFAARKAIPAPDPVSLAVLAIDRVGPAAVRACASGVEVRSQRRTRLPHGCCARHWPKPRAGETPIG